MTTLWLSDKARDAIHWLFCSDEAGKMTALEARAYIAERWGQEVSDELSGATTA